MFVVQLEDLDLAAFGSVVTGNAFFMRSVFVCVLFPFVSLGKDFNASCRDLRAFAALFISSLL